MIISASVNLLLAEFLLLTAVHNTGLPHTPIQYFFIVFYFLEKLTVQKIFYIFLYEMAKFNVVKHLFSVIFKAYVISVLYLMTSSINGGPK